MEGTILAHLQQLVTGDIAGKRHHQSQDDDSGDGLHRGVL
jgi:hypothetical protein